jgi:hypothetical protein
LSAFLFNIIFLCNLPTFLAAVLMSLDLRKIVKNTKEGFESLSRTRIARRSFCQQ